MVRRWQAGQEAIGSKFLRADVLGLGWAIPEALSSGGKLGGSPGGGSMSGSPNAPHAALNCPDNHAAAHVAPESLVPR